MPAYIKAFLDQGRREGQKERNLYRCRVCGREWEKLAPQTKGEGTRPSLVRLGDE